MNARRIESSASRTADMTCACRAISFFERDPLFKGADWVAPKLLPRKLQPMITIGLLRLLLRRVFGAKGAYEWVIARTRYFDDALQTACKEGFRQVLVFGAGFDSRGVRFCSELKEKKLFELDAPTTQEMKRRQFRQRGVEIPSNVFLVPVNFEAESFEPKLVQAGFQPGYKTLVLLEGVLQYLNPQAVEATLVTVGAMVGKGSRIVFDHAYSSVLRGEGNAYGQKRIIHGVRRFGESWQFGLDEAEVAPFLARLGLTVKDQKSPEQLERINFRNGDGKLRAKVNGTQGIVTAELQ